MNRPDTPSHTALVIGDQSVEVMDLSDYLDVSGWQRVRVARDAHAAQAALAQGEPFDLIVLSLPHADPDTQVLLRAVLSTDAAIILINGARPLMRGPRIVGVTRPYSDEDLTAAVVALGFLAES